MERITLETTITRIVQKIGRPRAIAWLKENYGVATFSKLDNAGLAAFIHHFSEHA